MFVAEVSEFLDTDTMPLETSVKRQNLVDAPVRS